MQKGARQKEESSEKELLCCANQTEEGARIFLVAGNTSGLRASQNCLEPRAGRSRREGTQRHSSAPPGGSPFSPQAEEPAGDDAVPSGSELGAVHVAGE